MMRAVWRAWFVFMLFCCTSHAQGQPAPETAAPYRLGVFPYLPPMRIEELYAPAAADFAAALRREVRLRTKKTFDAWYDEVKQQHYDIVWIQPFDYIYAFEKYGYLPLARDSEPLAAVIMANEDTSLQSLAELRGQTVALPPARAAVSHLTKIALLEAGLEPGKSVTVRHFINHDSCLQQVLIGGATACGTARAVVRNFTLRRGAALRELAVTLAIPHSLFAVHQRVSAPERERLLEVILGWPKTAKGRRFLTRAGRKSFVKAVDPDYDIVRQYARRLRLSE